MPLNQIASYCFFGSLFGVLAIWGFWSTAWNANWPVLALLGAALASLVMWAVFSLEAFRRWLKKRSTQFGIGLAVTAAASIAILVIINWVATENNHKFDVTQNKLFTLSDQSKKIVSELKSPMTIRVWTTSVERMSANIDMRKFLENYQIASRGHLKVEIKNPNEDTLGATKDNIKRNNIIVVHSESGRESRIDSFDDAKSEQQVTNAIVQAIKGGHKKTVCFLSGHGEYSLSDSQNEGLSFIKTRLEDSSYQTKEITLATQEKMPVDCEALVIVGPKGEASEREMKMIQDYMDHAGKIVALLGPGVSPSWKKFAAPFGVEIRSDVIIDPRVDQPIVVATTNYARDVEITKGFNRLMILPQVSSIQLPTVSLDAKVKIKTFISSELSTYNKEGNLKAMQTLKMTPRDLKGPLPIGVIINKSIEAKSIEAKPITPPAKHGFNWIPSANAQEIPTDSEEPPANADKKPEDEMVMVLISNHTFIANSVVNQGGNSDLFLNTINYLLKDQDLIGIRPRELRQATLDIPADRQRSVKATIFGMALIFLLLGIRAGHRRRASV